MKYKVTVTFTVEGGANATEVQEALLCAYQEMAYQGTIVAKLNDADETNVCICRDEDVEVRMRV